jgi:putative membrane protein
MRNMLLTTTAITLLMLAAPVSAQTSTQGQSATQGTATEQARQALSEQDLTFVEKAALGSRFEIEASTVARNTSSDARIDQIAERLIADHQKASAELTQIVQPLDAPIPAQLDDQRRQKLSQLQQSSGEIERAYLTAMVESHQESVRLFEQQAQQGQNLELKAFAQKTVPVLREHLQMVQMLQSAPAGSTTMSHGEPSAGQLAQSPAPGGGTVTPGDARAPTVTAPGTGGVLTPATPGSTDTTARVAGTRDQTAGRTAGTGAVDANEALIGADVVTADGRELGEIENLLIGDDGRVRAVVVAWGGILGLGERRAALPFEQVQINAGQDDKVVVNLTQQQIRDMPAYDEDNLAQFGPGTRAMR